MLSTAEEELEASTEDEVVVTSTAEEEEVGAVLEVVEAAVEADARTEEHAACAALRTAIFIQVLVFISFSELKVKVKVKEIGGKLTKSLSSTTRRKHTRSSSGLDSSFIGSSTLTSQIGL